MVASKRSYLATFSEIQLSPLKSYIFQFNNRINVLDYNFQFGTFHSATATKPNAHAPDAPLPSPRVVDKILT